MHDPVCLERCHIALAWRPHCCSRAGSGGEALLIDCGQAVENPQKAAFVFCPSFSCVP